MGTLQNFVPSVAGFSQRTDSAFDYPYLPNDGNYFRLVQLFADHDADPIRCELFTARRSDWEQQYFAISYVWGEKEKPSYIQVNGCYFEVRRNLFDFLGAFRRYTRGNKFQWSILWIDATCIDQRTMAEKNHQVQDLGHIFRDAACVFAWLGQGETAFETLLEGIDNDVQMDRKNMDLLKLTYTNAYWTRLWIVQEVLLARNLLYLYGKVACRRDRMEKAINEQLGSYNRLRTLTAYQSFGDRRFADLFRVFGCLGCSLDHDRIFGLLGIANLGQNNVRLRVDYGMSRAALFKETICLVDHSERFDFVRNFVLTVRLTIEDIDTEPANTWDALLDEYLVAEIECLPDPIKPDLRVVTDDSTPPRQTTIGLTVSNVYSPSEYGEIPADPCMNFELEGRLVRAPLNPHFPSGDANTFDSCFVFRPAAESEGSGIDHGEGCTSPNLGFMLSGIAVRSFLLEGLLGDKSTVLLLEEVFRLQDLLRVLINNPVATYRLVGTRRLLRGARQCTMALPLLPYLRFLAQLRQVIVMLDNLPPSYSPEPDTP